MDIEDAHKLKILTTETVKKLFLDFFDDNRKKHINEVLEIVSDLNEQIVYLRSCVIGTLIDECSTLFCREEQALLEGRFKGALVDHISERPGRPTKIAPTPHGRKFTNRPMFWISS